MIRAVFEKIDDCVRFEEVFSTKTKFLRTHGRNQDRYRFINAVDMDRGIVIYPATIPEYRDMP